jgi:hypothetical protein
MRDRFRANRFARARCAREIERQRQARRQRLKIKS